MKRIVFVLLLFLPLTTSLLFGCSGDCEYQAGYKTVFYKNGSDFTDFDGCNTCYCRNGEVACTQMACSDPEEYQTPDGRSTE